MALAVCLAPTWAWAEETLPEDGGEESDIVLSEQSATVATPRVIANPSASGKVATWDCVWFGSYPQTEVEPSDSLYARLKSASWDASGNATVNGVRYRRISKSDATDSSWWESDGYGDATYRYFRYEPIKWRVLEVTGTTALVVADVALDFQYYNINDTDVTWERVRCVLG